MKKLIRCAICLVFILSVSGCCGSQAKAAEAAEKMITLTLTPQYACGIADEWLDANQGTDYQSYERQADGSVVLTMTAEQYTSYTDAMRSGIVSAIKSMAASDHNNITDISFSDDFSAFRVTVKTDTLHRSDADSAYYMLTAYGRLYQCLTTYHCLTTGSEDCLEGCSVVITYLDADGNILEEGYSPE